MGNILTPADRVNVVRGGKVVKVSVIMPSYNVGGYIEEALRSAINQNLKEIEIICIDAGSKDGTWELLQKIAEEDERILLVRTSRKSYGYQVNLGIRMAQGEYIAVLETDDFAAPEMYEKLYRAAVENDCDYVKADYIAYWTQKNGERVFLSRKNLSDARLYDRCLCPRDYPSLGADDWYLWTGIYKKSFLKGILFSETPGAAFQDIGFLIQTTQKADRVIYIKDKLYHYCIDREGASSNDGRGLSYSYEEFNKITEKEKLSGQEAKLLYGRMAKSLICCYSQLTIDRRNHEKVAEIYGWFQEKLQIALKNDWICEDTVGRTLWRKLVELLEDDRAYLIKENSYRTRFLEKIMTQKNCFPVVIFGCGNIGYEAYRWLDKAKSSICCFMDNDSSLWGSSLNGIEVKNPDAVKELSEDAYFLIANENHALEIKTQLESLGVQPERIYLYR